jgi:hypothetical protein
VICRRLYNGILSIAKHNYISRDVQKKQALIIRTPTLSIMSAHQVPRVTGDFASELLRLTSESANIFPPLKSAAEGALHIVEIVAVS